jgi:hypothetical protein
MEHSIEVGFRRRENGWVKRGQKEKNQRNARQRPASVNEQLPVVGKHLARSLYFIASTRANRLVAENLVQSKYPPLLEQRQAHNSKSECNLRKFTSRRLTYLRSGWYQHYQPDRC